jgi:hypothetical protein
MTGRGKTSRNTGKEFTIGRVGSVAAYVRPESLAPEGKAHAWGFRARGLLGGLILIPTVLVAAICYVYLTIPAEEAVLRAKHSLAHDVRLLRSCDSTMITV